MPRIRLGIIVDIVAGLLATGLLSALALAITPVRPHGQAWLWLLAIASTVAAGTARRCLVARVRREHLIGSTRTSTPSQDRRR